jgi:signal peptidase II
MWHGQWYLLALVVIGLDQVTKILAENYLQYGQPVVLTAWFNLTLQYNTGAAFSFLSDAGGWQRYFFSTVAAVMSVVLVVWLYRLSRRQWLLALMWKAAKCDQKVIVFAHHRSVRKP